MITSENFPTLQDKTMEEEIQLRRERVNELLAHGWTEKKIAEELGVAKITIVRDVKWLKDKVSNWADELLQNDFYFLMKKYYDEYEYLRGKCHEFLNEEHPLREKLKIITTINDLIANQAEVISHGPVLQKLKQFVKNHQNCSFQ